MVYVWLLFLWRITSAVSTLEHNITPLIPPGDPRLCLSGNEPKLIRFEVLPGRGWDNLRNKQSGRVVDFAYTQCQTTDDGRFLIPDSVDTVPLKSSRVEIFSELFDHWMNYTSTTSNSINVDAGLNLGHFGVSGKFSSEFENVKKHQVNDKSVTTRVQLRYSRYAVKLQPDPTLNKVFRQRLHSIASNLLLNRTENAVYESQLLVRDYGTHVVTSIEAGASLSQEDHIKSTFSSDYSMQKSSITASASASFMSVAHIDVSYNHMTSKETIDQYIGNRTHSIVQTFGGPLFRPANYSASDWEKGVDNNLVALDISGDPIFYLITPYLFPELPPSTVYQLMLTVQSAVDLYYKFNTYRGCTSMDSPNFSYRANVDDGTCKSPSTNFTFAGVYQTCAMTDSRAGDLCSTMVQKNPLTGDYSCPSGYTAVLLHEGTLSKTGTRHSCHRCWLVATCCHDDQVSSSATYSVYWCYAQKPPSQQSGFLFGGVYTTTVSNPLTQAHSCPKFFYPLRMNKDMYVCVSDDYELGFQYSIPFAGFYSCTSGNPLSLQTKEMLRAENKKGTHTLGSYLKDAGSSVWPKACPNGYSQHLATVDQSCEINYCVEADAFSSNGLPRIRRPPFMTSPSSGFPGISSVKIGPRGLEWTYLNGTTESAYESGDHSATGPTQTLSQGAVAGITIAATLLCVIIASVIIMRFKRHKITRAFRKRNLDSSLETDAMSQDQQSRYGTNSAGNSVSLVMDSS